MNHEFTDTHMSREEYLKSEIVRLGKTSRENVDDLCLMAKYHNELWRHETDMRSRERRFAQHQADFDAIMPRIEAETDMNIKLMEIKRGYKIDNELHPATLPILFIVAIILIFLLSIAP